MANTPSTRVSYSTLEVSESRSARTEPSFLLHWIEFTYALPSSSQDEDESMNSKIIGSPDSAYANEEVGVIFRYRGGDLYLNDDNEPEAGKLKAEYARSFVSSLSLDLNEPLEDLGVEDDDAVLIDDGNGRFEELRYRWARLHFSGDGQTPTTSVPAGSGGRRLRGYSSSTVQQQLTFDEIGVGDGVKC
nr:catechol oxidase [Ipomoea batatas]